MTDKLIGNFDKTESLTVTMPMEEFDKLEKLALSAHTDKLSVEKLQEQLNTAVEALTEIKNAFGGATFIDSKNKIHSVSDYVTDKLAALEGGENESIRNN